LINAADKNAEKGSSGNRRGKQSWENKEMDEYDMMQWRHPFVVREAFIRDICW